MKKRLFAICALFVFAVPVLAQQLNWTPFKEPILKFAVLFPNDPVRNAPDVKKRDDGSVQSTSYLFTAISQGNYMALAGATDYNAEIDTERELAADRDNFATGSDTKLVASRRYEFLSGDEKLPAMAFSSQDNAWFFKGVFVVRGNRAYCAIFGYRKGQDSTSAVDKFLDSFEITK